MKLSYHSDTDSLYIHLKDKPGIETQEVATGINVDFDSEGRPIGIDIEHAENILDLSKISTEELPVFIRSA